MDSEDDTETYIHAESSLRGSIDDHLSSIPLIRPSPQGSILIPPDPPTGYEDHKAKPAYEVVVQLGLDSDLRGRSAYLYQSRVSSGQTCDVYEVDARWAWSTVPDAAYDGRNTVKLAVKRLSNRTTLAQFVREYDALRATKKRYHPNIVKVLNAFRYEDEDIHYNFSFPLASGNLKQLFRGSLSTTLVSKSLNNLWTQFEGLASALAYLHDECMIVHADLKPSNILLYEISGTPSLIAKLADFGLAVSLQQSSTWQLGTAEAQSAWRYDAPEVREMATSTQGLLSNTSGDSQVIPSRIILPYQARNGDIWKLGAVFVELLTFLVSGEHGVLKFRDYITTSREGFRSDNLSETRLDDGVKVKKEVLDWLRLLSKRDVRAEEIQPLLREMLDKDTNRPSASSVSNRLQMSSLCLFSDGTRFAHITDWEFVPPLSLIDKCKERVEKWIGQSIDWWPLRNGRRTCPQGHARITWEWSGEELSVDVPSESAEIYRRSCGPISHAPPPSTRLPLYQSSNVAVDQAQDRSGRSRKHASQSLDASQTGPDIQMGIHHSGNTSDTSSDSSTVQEIPKELYWCVDKSWNEPAQTRLCLIKNVHQLPDDQFLCQSLVSEYRRVRGLKGRLLSWKRCLGVDFIKFGRVSAGHDQIVRISMELPPPDLDKYDYTLLKSEVVHMAIAATQLIAAIHNPAKGSGISTTMAMLPKRIGGPLPSDVGSEGWESMPVNVFRCPRY